MSYTQGRNWDYRVKKIDGREVRFFFEVARGTRMYFQLGGKWLVARMFQDNDPFDVGAFTTSEVVILNET